MKSTTFNRRLLPLILVFLVVSTACIDRKPPELGHIYFSRDSRIWKFDLGNGQETQLLDRSLIESIEVSPNGKTLSYIRRKGVQQNSDRGIWIMDIYTGQETEVSHAMPFLEAFWLPDNRLAVLEYPAWHVSADGTDLVKEGDVQPFIIEPTTGESTQASWFVTPPDNGSILYAPTFDCAAERLFNDQAPDILQVACLNASEPITVAMPQSLGNIAWSLDGKLLAFYAGEETTTWDTWQLYLWQRESEALRRIDINGRTAVGLSFSPNNDWLAFEDGSTLCFVNLIDDRVICFEHYLSAVGEPVSWSWDSRSVTWATRADHVCHEIGYDCSKAALVTMVIPSGEITLLTTDVDITPCPIWSK